MVKFQLRHGNDLLAMDCIRNCDVSISTILQAPSYGGGGTWGGVFPKFMSFAIRTIFSLSYTAPKDYKLN